MWWVKNSDVSTLLCDVLLTLSKGVIDAKTAQDLIDIAGVEESISSHHHLESLWVRQREIQMSPQKLIRTL